MSDVSRSTVRFETAGAIATITLDRPAKRNAIDADMTTALRAAIARLEGDPALRVGILTGAGGHFCAGLDLAAFAAGSVAPVLFEEGGFAGFVKRSRTKPVIAAVEGSALAGGFELMLACDLAVAAQGARFGLPEVTDRPGRRWWRRDPPVRHAAQGDCQRILLRPVAPSTLKRHCLTAC